MRHTNSKKNTDRFVTQTLESIKGLSDLERKIQAGLLVEDIQTVDVDRAFNRVSSRIQDRRTITRSISWITRAAAVLTIPLLAFTIWNLTVNNRAQQFTDHSLSWQEIENPLGIRSHIILPDSTDLWLNAGSKIRYSIPFIRDSRHIELIGEAFLHVSKNEEAPFIVHADQARIRVLGTQFNVKAYPEEEQIEVALKEGSVEFHFMKENSEEGYTQMVPNDFIRYDKAGCTLTKENLQIDKFIAWRENKLICDNMPMEELAIVIERWYGVKVIIHDEEIKQYHFNGTIENETIQDVMKILKMTLAISYTVDNKVITINKL